MSRIQLYNSMSPAHQRAYVRYIVRPDTLIQFATKFSRVQGEYEYCMLNHTMPYLPELTNQEPLPNTVKIYRVVGLHTYFISSCQGKIDRACKNFHLDLIAQYENHDPIQRREALKPNRSKVIEDQGFYDIQLIELNLMMKNLSKLS
ncbi:hypothetical protein VPHD239_0186 [Vibrio phage D239]